MLVAFKKLPASAMVAVVSAVALLSMSTASVFLFLHTPKAPKSLLK